MIIEFFSGPMGIAAIFSFFISSFGYVIARMWVQPLWRYRLLKSRIRILMDAAENLPDDTDTQALIRKAAAKLADCYNKSLPQWYQLMLSNRNESPDTAVADLMALANVKDRQHATKRIANVRLALKITPEHKKG
ncbi:MAG: hypothetical protein GY697_23285 [Desulfobacterales bacterium]|nr:hypothetical protein [Desulfobacterales bacterium]